MLNDLFIKPDFDASKAAVSFTNSEKIAEGEYEVLQAGQIVANGEFSSAEKKIAFDISLPDFKSWSVEDPNLYLLKLKFNSGVEVEQAFAMTKIGVKNRTVYFNNAPIYIRGFIRGRKGHEHQNLTGCSETEFYEKNIKMAKAFGFNFVRFHSTVPPKEFLEAADRLGFLCHVEIRPYYGKYQKERESTGFENDQRMVEEDDWKKMIHKLRNHPCVLVYCMGNEINRPGNNDRVKIISKLTKKLDPTRLFLDTCSRGEYDRDTVDIDVQHMSYFAPFGPHYDMYDDTIHLAIYGSSKNNEMVVQENDSNYRMLREVQLKHPLLAHEACHYNVLRDHYELDKKFRKYKAPKPWWIDESIKMIEAKGHKKQFKTMLEASTRFQYMWIKQNLESIRKSQFLQGFQFLQLSDNDDYENANGLLDCFDDIKDIEPEKVLPFNSPSVLIADLPQRSFMENTKIEIPVWLSHYSHKIKGKGTLKWQLKSKDNNDISISGQMAGFNLDNLGLQKLCRIEINLPETDKPQWLTFNCQMVSDNNGEIIENNWDIWLFPNNSDRIKPLDADIDLKYYRPQGRYPQIRQNDNANLLITECFNEKVIGHLEAGKDVLVLYRIDENRSKTAKREKYYLPSTWERFKGIIWDRGHNCGGFTRKHPVIDKFPQDGFVNWQFYNLIEDSDKIDLDDFPVKIEPIIEGVDKAVRDRFDVGRFDLSEFQYAYTMRKFAYLFELKIGKGRLMVAGMNFKGLETDVPEVCWMFESIINYMASPEFDPNTYMTVEEFENYLLEKGQAKRIKERMMTQYWQLDDAPLESKQYWKESEEWLRSDD